MFSSYIRFYKGESLARSSEILFLSRTLHQQESKIDQPTRCTMVQKLKFRFEKIHKPITFRFSNKVEKILKASLDLISSPSPSVKTQIMGGKVFVDNIQQCFAFIPFPPIICFFTEGEGDGIASRLSS